MKYRLLLYREPNELLACVDDVATAQLMLKQIGEKVPVPLFQLHRQFREGLPRIRINGRAFTYRLERVPYFTYDDLTNRTYVPESRK